MSPRTYAIDADIRVASTLDAAFYRDEAAYAATRERVFARTWQWIGALGDVAAIESFAPRELLPGLLDEPLLLARDASKTLRCLSNVCTHRGNILVHAPGRGPHLRCGYHARRFDLAGRMTFMPEFQEAADFPSRDDDLPEVPFEAWAGHAFAALNPVVPLADFIGDLTQEYSMTTIVVTHDMNSVLGIGENILFIYEGRKLWEGSNKDIMHSGVKDFDDFVFANKVMSKIREK